jgi:hypothetical protein
MRVQRAASCTVALNFGPDGLQTHGEVVEDCALLVHVQLRRRLARGVKLGAHELHGARGLRSERAGRKRQGLAGRTWRALAACAPIALCGALHGRLRALAVWECTAVMRQREATENGTWCALRDGSALWGRRPGVHQTEQVLRGLVARFGLLFHHGQNEHLGQLLDDAIIDDTVQLRSARPSFGSDRPASGGACLPQSVHLHQVEGAVDRRLLHHLQAWGRIIHAGGGVGLACAGLTSRELGCAGAAAGPDACTNARFEAGGAMAPFCSCNLPSFARIGTGGSAHQSGPLQTALEVLAVLALAVLRTQNVRLAPCECRGKCFGAQSANLEAFTVLLEALGVLAAAALVVDLANKGLRRGARASLRGGACQHHCG